MKKIIIPFMVFMVLIPLVLAINEGQIFTQNQLDAQDIDSIDLECRYERGTLAWRMDRDSDTNEIISKVPLGIEAEFSCLAMRYRGAETNDYEVYRHHITPLFRTKKLLECEATVQSVASCKSDIINFFLQEVRSLKGGIKQRGKDYQTVTLDNLNFEDDL